MLKYLYSANALEYFKLYMFPSVNLNSACTSCNKFCIWNRK